MRWWPWRRRHPRSNGEAAKRAKEGASEALAGAHGQSRQVEETARAARELVRRADLFAREVERSMRLRGTS